MYGVNHERSSLCFSRYFNLLCMLLLFCGAALIESRPSIKPNCLLYPYLPTFNPPTQNFVLELLKKYFFCPIFIRKSRFSHYAAMKETKMQTNVFSYLPTQQKIQGRGTASKQSFKNGLRKKALMRIEQFDVF